MVTELIGERVDALRVSPSAWATRPLRPGAVVEWTHHSGEHRAMYAGPTE